MRLAFGRQVRGATLVFVSFLQPSLFLVQYSIFPFLLSVRLILSIMSILSNTRLNTYLMTISWQSVYGVTSLSHCLCKRDRCLTSSGRSLR